MKYFLPILICLLFSHAGHSQSSSAADKIIGNWLNEEKDAKIEIYKSENTYFGKLVWGDKIFEADGKTSRKDANNEDKELKKRDLLNLILLTNFIFDDGSWTGGKVYDPKSGKTYSCTIKFKGEKLEIRGYMGIALFGRTTIWSRQISF
jgi:uncharacterized protein (DUF2147 family)